MKPASAEIEALLAGRHHDPHRVLGFHEEGSVTVIRALRPGAIEVIVHTEAEHVVMQRLGALFEAEIPSGISASTYELETVYLDGTRTVEFDPYAFPPSLGELDLHLFGEGRHGQLSEVLGARRYAFGDVIGTAFTVWAPSALAVSLVGELNAWNEFSHPMRSLGASGIWELFIAEFELGRTYKFAVLGRDDRRRFKADPCARASEDPPRTASVVWQSDYRWDDAEWLEHRSHHSPWREAMSTYELHLGSWRPGLGYRELAEQIADYVVDLGFTHVELMPIMEHPFSGSWGYQVTGFYAPTARFGTPDEFRRFVDTLHQRGLGVICDWVPAHFPRDEWALAQFDGTALYEHEDERRGAHPDWGTLIFNYGRHEVRNFLIGSANTWLSEYHCDGLRVDAVASMIYLDYSRRPGEWIPNSLGGREDLEALQFLRELNVFVYREQPGTVTIAEESTAWSGVSRPVSAGGLGFGFKWNMGWMHDTLAYFSLDPIYRRHHHNELTFSAIYAFSENFVLPLSHDEVVHGKGSLVSKMAGDRWQKFANLRALYGYMWAHPGKKLLFMGSEFAQEREWNHQGSLDWCLLQVTEHAQIRDLVRDLNRFYRSEPALWELDSDPAGFGWVEANDSDNNVIAFLRHSAGEGRDLLCVCNLSPVPRYGYRLGVPMAGRWKELLNTDASLYGGANVGNGGWAETSAEPEHGYNDSLILCLPPLATLWFVPESQR